MSTTSKSVPSSAAREFFGESFPFSERFGRSGVGRPRKLPSLFGVLASRAGAGRGQWRPGGPGGGGGRCGGGPVGPKGRGGRRPKGEAEAAAAAKRPG